MKLLSKLPRVNFYKGFGFDNPILLFDAYTHKFTFVTVQDPRKEKGVTIALCILKFKMILSFYVDEPYTPKHSLSRIRLRNLNGKK